jgi:chemotaxis protein MotB
MANDSIIIKKKKVVGHGGHHGGSWKVAYADFVTAMMAFFMVMWIMGLSDDTQAAISGYFNDPSGFMKNPPKSRNVIVLIPGSNKQKSASEQNKKGEGLGDFQGLAVSEAQEGQTLKIDIQKSLEGIPDLQKLMDHIEINITKEGLRVELLEDAGSVFFQSGSAQISQQGRKIVKQITPVFAKTGRYLVIEGHTDAKPYAGKEYTNWELSTDRARSLRRELSVNGMPNDRFRGVNGFADTKLRFPNKPLSPANRRVTLLLPWGEKVKGKDAKQSANLNIRQAISPPAFDIHEKAGKKKH